MLDKSRPRLGRRLLTAAALLWSTACGSASAQEAPAAPPAAPVVAPADRVVYLVMTDRFVDGDPSNNGAADDQLLAWHGGDFRGLTTRLPYLAELGVTTIWITPIVDQIDHSVEGAGLPHWGYHGYWAEDFTRIDPHLGEAADLVALIDGAHQAGLEIILDVVLNHPGYDSHFVTEGGWVRECPGPDEPHDDLTQCLFGLPDFVTEDPEVARQLIEWQTSWFLRYPWDGLRADTVKHVGTEVWRRFLAAVRAARPEANFWALGESWGTIPQADEPLLAEGLFDATYDFGFSNLILGWLNHRMRSAALGHHLGRRNDAAIGRYVHYLDTHDTPTFTSLLDSAESYPLALVLLMTSAGMPLLYYGDELARGGGEWPHNRPDMPWELVDDPEATPLALVRQLTALRRGHPALTRGAYEELVSEEGLVVYSRHTEADRVVVGLNRGPEAATFPCPEGMSCAPAVCVNCVASEGGISLLPWGAAVLTQP